jgi:hypothetical protein
MLLGFFDRYITSVYSYAFWIEQVLLKLVIGKVLSVLGL